jgi:Pseudomurein endo-isopeptidase Pei.
MNKLMKILAFIILVAVVAMLTGVISADNSTLGSESGVQSGTNDVFNSKDDFGSPDMGNNCSGVAVEFDDLGFAGTVHTLTNTQYKEMWKRIAKWQAQNPGKVPNYVTISDMKVGIDRVTKDQFLDMKKRWEAWKKVHNNQEPSKIGIEGPVGGTSPVVSGSIQKALINAVGIFTSFTAFYKLCKNRKYSFYKNNKYSRSNAIKRLKNRSGLNCVDVSQLGYALAKEMGYQVKFQETSCRGPDGKPVGHVLLKIKGKEFNSWEIVDLAGCISCGMPLGEHWGKPPYDAVYNWVE